MAKRKPKKNPADDPAFRKGFEAGQEHGQRIVLSALFDTSEPRLLEECRNNLCDLLWWGKGFNAAKGEYDMSVPLYDLQRLIQNFRGYLDRDKNVVNAEF